MPTIQQEQPQVVGGRSGKPLLLAINGKFLAQPVTGVERYARNVLAHLVPLSLKRGHKVVLISPSRSNIPDCFQDRGAVAIASFPMLPSFWGRHLWEQMALPLMALFRRADVLINLTNTCPLLFRSNVLTLHDVSWIQNPSWFSRSFAVGYSAIIPLAVRWAKLVVTVSEWSKSEISSKLNVQRTIEVFHEGAGPEFTPVVPNKVKEDLASLGIEDEYILHVGTLQPRKNLSRLLEAYQKLCSGMEKPPLLVLAGGSRGHFGSSDAEKFMANSDRVKCLGYTPDALLPSLYSGCLFYISASLYEGFGLTLLEAMSCGAPVAASEIMPHREVAGDVAHYFRPDDVDNISAAMLRMATDEDLRERLRANGPDRAGLFSWQKHARSILDAIEQSC